MKSIRSLEIASLALVMVISAYVIYAASAWQLQAKLFPWVVAFPLLALSAVRLAITLRSAPVAASESSAVADLGLWNAVARRETGRLVAWLAAFLVLIGLFSFLIGLPLAMLAYLKVESRERWWLAVALSLATFAYLFAIFDQVLHVPWPSGLITSQFGL
jgi:Tripartite tricarboxylate transporter TctB family